MTTTSWRKSPRSSAQKRFILRGKVMEFTDYDGQPCALVCVSNPATGVWEDALYVVLSTADEVEQGGVYTFYLIGEAITLPADGAYTRSGTEQEVPVATAVYVTKKQMSALKIENVLRAGLMAWAMFMDLNVRSGDNYVNIGQSLVGTSGAVALAALVCLLALSWADERLPKAGLRVRLAALFLGVWQVIAVSVVNTNGLNQPFLSGSQKLKAAVLALGMASLFELFSACWRPGWTEGWICGYKETARCAGRIGAHTLLFCMAAVLLCWLPHLAVSYPASMNSDTQSQFDQILGLFAVEQASSDASGVLPAGDDPAGACAGQRKRGLVCLCAGAGGLCGGGDRVQPVDHAQALRAGLAAGAFACAVRFRAGVLRQHHGDPQGCSLQLRDAVDALRDGSTAFSGKGKRRV